MAKYAKDETNLENKICVQRLHTFSWLVFVYLKFTAKKKKKESNQPSRL